MSNGNIVVGWDGSDASRSAISWAAYHAVTTRRNLVITHEVARGSEFDNGNEDSSGDEELTAIVQRLLSRSPHLQTTTAAEQEDVSSGLLRWSATADILALGAPAHPHQRLLGDLTDHLAVTADSPVALVPLEYVAPMASSRPVVVGLADTPSGRLALQFAATEAVRMGRELIALSAAGDSAAAHRDAAEMLEKTATHWAGLSVVSVLANGFAGDELVDLSTGAELIIVGCHHSNERWSIRLGAVTQTVLHGSSCPVITVGRWRKSSTERISDHFVAEAGVTLSPRVARSR